jgi:hypothetical protein
MSLRGRSITAPRRADPLFADHVIDAVEQSCVSLGNLLANNSSLPQDVFYPHFALLFPNVEITLG